MRNPLLKSLTDLVDLSKRLASQSRTEGRSVSSLSVGDGQHPCQLRIDKIAENAVQLQALQDSFDAAQAARQAADEAMANLEQQIVMKNQEMADDVELLIQCLESL
jgi:hypothetical protein